MSYDVILEKKMVDPETGETESMTVGSFNYTSNLHAFFTDFFDGDQGIFELNGLSGKEVKIVIDNFQANMLEEGLRCGNSGMTKSEFEGKYNPENGWGSIDSAWSFLEDIRETAIKNPSAVCFVCS